MPPSIVKLACMEALVQSSVRLDHRPAFAELQQAVAIQQGLVSVHEEGHIATEQLMRIHIDKVMVFPDHTLLEFGGRDDCGDARSEATPQKYREPDRRTVVGDGQPRHGLRSGTGICLHRGGNNNDKENRE